MIRSFFPGRFRYAPIIAVLLCGCGSEEPQGTDTVYTENTLKWQTASEENLFGFHIYRAESEEGPFERLNRVPVAGAGTTDEVGSYEFVDAKAVPGRTYYYYLETLQFDNRRKKYSPVFPYETPAS